MKNSTEDLIIIDHDLSALPVPENIISGRKRFKSQALVQSLNAPLQTDNISSYCKWHFPF